MCFASVSIYVHTYIQCITLIFGFFQLQTSKNVLKLIKTKNLMMQN